MLDNNFAFAVVRSEFPHIGHLLQKHWDAPDFTAVMDDLLNPDPRRKGFPSGVLKALRSLALMHEMEVTYSARQGDQSKLSLNLEHFVGRTENLPPSQHLFPSLSTFR